MFCDNVGALCGVPYLICQVDCFVNHWLYLNTVIKDLTRKCISWKELHKAESHSFAFLEFKDLVVTDYDPYVMVASFTFLNR